MHSESPITEIPNPNHPKLGDTIKVEPIRTVNAINNLKKYLAPSPRNFALLVAGINTAYRASELLSIRVGQVRHLQPGDRLEVKQKKNEEVPRGDDQHRLPSSHSDTARAPGSKSAEGTESVVG